MNLDNTSTSAALSGFIAGVVITVLSALVFVPAGGSGAGNVLAGSQTGTGGDDGTGLFDGDSGGDGEAGTDGGSDGDPTGLFGSDDGSGDATGDGADTGGSAPSGATTGGGTTGGGTTGGGTTTGGTTDGGGTDGGTTDGTTGGTTDGTTGGTTDGTTGDSTAETTSGGDDGGTTSGGGDDGGATSSGGQLACQPGSNGGSTDTGITGDSIKMGATIVKKGVGASFLGEAKYAMDAVIRKVNSAGGICGRQFDILYKNDDWDADKGFQYIQDLVEAEKVFALAVVPSSEGLNAASEAGYFEREKVPVVGSDGMIRSQYTDDYIFPVATSTVSMMHIMADHAWNKLGAREFGLVFEKTYRFGIEGAYAFNQAYKRLSGGKDIKGYENPFGSPTCQSGTHFCAIAANQNDYSNANQNFNNGCKGTCDYVAYLMEPSTALQWFRSGGSPASASDWSKGAGAAQPLFTYDFGSKCGDPCDDLWVWTGYNPPIEDYANKSGVRQYVNDLHAINAQADEFNQFTEGAYLGMVALAEAIAKTGPDLTRQRLMDTLYNIEVDIGLSQPLSWSPGNHQSNISAQAFEINYQSGFKEWFFKQGYMQDRWPGEDME